MRRPPDIEKQMDKCINIAHGVKGGDTLRKYVRATGESPCDHRENGVSRSIRWKLKAGAKFHGKSETPKVVKMNCQQKRFGAKER